MRKTRRERRDKWSQSGCTRRAVRASTTLALTRGRAEEEFITLSSLLSLPCPQPAQWVCWAERATPLGKHFTWLGWATSLSLSACCLDISFTILSVRSQRLCSARQKLLILNKRRLISSEWIKYRCNLSIFC